MQTLLSFCSMPEDEYQPAGQASHLVAASGTPVNEPARQILQTWLEL